jgi:hypothetical protein
MDTCHIVAAWREATPAQFDKGTGWYRAARVIALQFAYKYDVSVEVAAGVIAATSPNNSWTANLKVAEKILFHRSAEYTHRGYLGTGLAKARRILAGESPETALESKTYYKVLNFYRGIMSGGVEGVCVDRHAYDIATGQRHTEDRTGGVDLPVRPNVSGKRYREVAQAYYDAARLLSIEEGRVITGCEVQAVTWIVQRDRFWSDGAFDPQAEEVAA